MGSTNQEELADRLRKMRESQTENGRPWSRSTLSRKTVGYDGKGLAEVTIKALEGGKNQPGAETLAALAHAFGVEPAVAFPEYRLALARDELDETKAGLDAALANLEAYEAAKASRDTEQEPPPRIAGDTGHRAEGQSPKRRGRRKPGSDQGKDDAVGDLG